METWDLIVIGGGPAGASGALVAGGNGLRTCLLEAGPELGGQLHWADAPILDLLGLPRASGRDLAASFRAQLETAGVLIRTEAPVLALDESDTGLLAKLAGGEALEARRVLLATGLRRRTLGVPSEDLVERSLSPRRDAERFRGQSVLVVGGGDEAADTARGLADAGAKVVLVVRSTLRARPLFAEPLQGRADLTVLEGARIQRFRTLERGGLAAELDGGRVLEAAACFVRIGAEPQLPGGSVSLARHPDGRLVVSLGGRTSNPRVYAAGDLVHGHGERYVSSAMGSGALAARAIEASLSSGLG